MLKLNTRARGARQETRTRPRFWRRDGSIIGRWLARTLPPASLTRHSRPVLSLHQEVRMVIRSSLSRRLSAPGFWQKLLAAAAVVLALLLVAIG
ncbi:MAG: hypothetical protein AB7S36_09105 [Planctomycetota bacterium]